MSEEEAKSFLKKVEEDKDLQEKLKRADSPEKFIAVAAEDGFNFTKEEWLAFTQMNTPEISEEDLTNAAGGGGDIDWDRVKVSHGTFCIKCDTKPDGNCGSVYGD